MIRKSDDDGREGAAGRETEGGRAAGGLTEPAEAGTVDLPQGLALEEEDPIVPCRIGFEWMGNPEGPVVVVLGGISANRHVGSHASDESPGWWEPFAGPGRPLDTRTYRVVGVDWIGGPGGSSAPHRRPSPEGIPAVTTRDQAAAVAAVLDHLGVTRVRAVVGASYGAMVALAFGERFADRAERIVVISGAHRSHPMATGLRALQRRIVLLGLEQGNARRALVLARALAMTTYRSPDEFLARFDNEPHKDGADYRFPVEDYLDHQGEKFAARFDPDHFLYLCQSLDLHRIEPSAVNVPTTLLAVEEDTLVPLWQMEELHEGIPDSELVVIRSPTGHDAFLVEEEAVGRLLGRVLPLEGGRS